MPYAIEDHHHRFAAWAASRGASVKGCRFKVHQGVAVLEACGFNAALSRPARLPSPTNLDAKHRQWRKQVIAAAKKEGLDLTHGVAAKLINIYLKVRFVCGGHHSNDRVQQLHPPIDELLLKKLAAVNFGGQAKLWRKYRQIRWSKFDSDTYEAVIELIRSNLGPDVPLWKVEEHWEGYQ